MHFFLISLKVGIFFDIPLSMIDYVCSIIYNAMCVFYISNRYVRVVVFM